MCGIAGIIRFNGIPVDQGELDRVTDALAHRGPNGRGTFLDRGVGLGHRRLSILDLSDAGKQPMSTPDGDVVVVFNGEIYNYREERRLLEAKGHTFRSQTDTEVLLALYREYGEDCLPRLRGMFAFVIYDRKRRTVFLARDRVGKKPLKYFATDGMFAFASELKALRTLKECPRDIELSQARHFLTLMYLPAPMTGFRGIEKLPAGHAMSIDLDTGKRSVRRYWSLSYAVDEGPTLREWQERVWERLKESVRLRMRSDVPLGAFLSGGIDSATVVALMSQMSDRPVETFSIGSDSEKYNELPDAGRVAALFRTNHHPIVVEPDIVRLLPDLVHTYEEPYGDTSAIPTYLIARESKRHVTVALNGDGGDENFAGYVRYPILRFSEFWHRMPRAVHRVADWSTSLFHRLRNDTLSYRMRRFQETIALPWERRYLQYLSYFTESEKDFLSGDREISGTSTDAWYAHITEGSRSRADDLVHRAMAMDLDTYLADDLLPKVDLGSMAHGLEARSPFLDHHLLECTASIPVKMLLHGRTGKWLLRDKVSGLLPPDLVWKRKRGFRIPLDQWFRSSLKPFVRERMFSAPSSFWNLVDRPRLETFLESYYASDVDFSDHIWVLLWLAEWMEQYT